MFHQTLVYRILINSAVLGLVFEKLNGYKDGSFYTPSFITSYMCKESIQKIVLNKFKSELGLNAKDINQLQQLILMSIKSNFDFKDECKKLLNSIRICDPAVGSGHFLVSALNELVYMYYELGLLDFQCDMVIDNDEILIKNTQGELFNYKKPKIQNDENHKIQKSMFNLKKQIIENSLFGVDINANSCEITKLRLWIELLKYSYYKELKTYHLETLPNIDINIKCGNSLISYFDVKQSLSNYPSINKKIKEYKHKVKMYKEGEFVKKDELSKDIKILHESFKSFCLSDKYKKQINAFDKKRQEYAKKYDDFLVCDDEDLKQYFGQKSFFKPEFNEKNAKEDFKKLKALHNEIFNLESYNPFEWRFEFPEVLDEKGNFTGFDLVIGNPPYIRHEAIKELKPRISHYKVFVSTADIYTYFYELALNISKPDGEVSFITSNKYTRAKYGEKLRDFILQNAKILNYIELNGIKVFDSATVDTSILSFQNSKSDEYEFAYKSPTTLEQLLDQAHTLSVKSLSKDSFTFGSSDTQALKSKIESIGTPLKEWDITINYGIKTGFNEAFIISKEKRDEILNSTCTKEERVRTEQIIKPLLRGRDIKRYAYQFADIYLINTNNGAKLKENPIAPIDINDYPTIKKHLDNFYPQLEKRQDKGDTPYNLRNCAYLEDFNKPKLVYSDMVRNAQFSYDTQQCVGNR